MSQSIQNQNLRSENLKHLQMFFLEFYTAYLSKNERKMQKIYDNFSCYFPDYFPLVINETIKLIQEKTGNTFIIPQPIYGISGLYLHFNIEACLKVIHRELVKNSIQPFTCQAILTLYSDKNSFKPNTVLYRKKATSHSIENHTKLTVSNLLKIFDYTLKVLNILEPDKITSEVSETITVIKIFKSPQNNKPFDKPFIQSLHAMNYVLSSIVKSSLKNEKNKQFVNEMNLLVDLAIDFFSDSIKLINNLS